MNIRTTTPGAEAPFFDHDLTPASKHRIEEMVFSDDSEWGRGDRRFIMLDGLVVTRRRHEILRDFDLWNEQEAPTVTMRFCLEGDVHARVPGFDGAVRTRAGNHNIVYTPACENGFVLRQDTAHEVVEVYLMRPYLLSLLEDYPDVLERYLSPVVRQDAFLLHRSGLTITPDMRQVIWQILDSQGQGALRRMFIAAKVTELMTLQLRQHDERSAHPRGAAPLSTRDVDRMHEARHLALSRLDDPPTLAELARRVGTNEFRLKRDFKAVFGQTVYGLLFDQRMAYGRALLLETDRPVGEIAQVLGYTHIAHFSTAFKKKYGVSPSAFRKMR